MRAHVSHAYKTIRVDLCALGIANVRWTRRVTDFHSAEWKSEVGSFVENLTNAHFEIIPGMAALARCDWETGKWLS